ncbi:proprotein convertase subtilisin/kexin type 5-like [Mytilus californianus]|uniref:proprotein convertase subtilisin/kexin type 5-like n=1 Tax=Mytilus californianus TaxID=6549 RepID=UPI002246AA5D|nr:proprotein convertase subtilisin/kexin type 5-like [Mytilus californianus]
MIKTSLFYQLLCVNINITVFSMVCLPTEVYLPGMNKCTKLCPLGTFVYDQKCVLTCPVFSKILKTELANFCYFKTEISCQTTPCNDEYPLCYRMDCLRTCPEFTVEYNQTCIMECPTNMPFITFYDCEGICSNGRKVCSTSCPITHPYILQTDFFLRCVRYCPEYTEEISKNKSCNLNCPSSKPLLFNKTCYSSCPDEASFLFLKNSKYNEIYTCEEQCPINTVVDNDRCVNFCPKGKHLFNNTCLTECPLSHKYLYPKSFIKTDEINSDRAEFSCVKVCNTIDNTKYSNDPRYVAFDNLCTDRCPPIAKYEFNVSCLKTCPNEHPFMEQTYRGVKCVDKCTHLQYNWTCVFYCPAEAKKVFNNFCLTSCPSEHSFMEPSHSSVNCVEGCKHLEFNKSCVQTCPFNAKYELNGSCLAACPSDNPFIVSDDISKCVDKCKRKQLLYKNTCYYNCPKMAKYEFNGSCVASCPDEYPFMELTKVNTRCTQSCKLLHFKNNCVSTCPSNAKFKYNSTCVNQCGSGLPLEYDEIIKIKATIYSWGSRDIVKYKHNYHCVVSCPDGTFLYNNSKCVVSCPLDKNIGFNGICYERCPVSHLYKMPRNNYFTCVKNCSTPITYNNTCLTKCPKEAEFEVYGSCVATCPQEKLFKELTTRNTYHCVGSCSILHANTTCVSVCPSEAKLQYKWSCVRTCEKDLPYAFHNTYILPNQFKCVKTCPSNTWLYNETYCVFVCPQTAKYYYENSCASECDTIRPYEYIINSKWYCEQKCPKNTFYFNLSCVTKCPMNSFMFDSKCIFQCPVSHPLNYTRNKKGYGIYECVYECPNEKFMHNNTCFDKCPGGMKSHLSSCIKICPNSHPITDSQSQSCVRVCPKNSVLKNNLSCVSSCPVDSIYIENQRCVERCDRYDAVIETTRQGKKCHDKCPQHLFLEEISNRCVGNCSKGLIVNNICKQIEKCPFQKYIEHSLIGRRCANRCSQKFFLNGANCVKECPPGKVIAGIECLDTCPSSFPLRYEDYTYLKKGIKCYKQCPSDYLAKGTQCISKYDCGKGYFTYQKSCLKVCPQWTVKSGDDCHLLITYITMTICCVLITILALIFLYVIIFYRGSSFTDYKMFFCRFQRKKEASSLVDTAFTLKQLLETDVIEEIAA